MKVINLPLEIHWHEYLDIPSLNKAQQSCKIICKKIRKHTSLSKYFQFIDLQVLTL